MICVRMSPIRFDFISILNLLAKVESSISIALKRSVLSDLKNSTEYSMEEKNTKKRKLFREIFLLPFSDRRLWPL